MNRKMSPSEAKSLLREAVSLNILASKHNRPTRFSQERDEIVKDLTAAGYPTNFGDFSHPSDVA